jgi:hypothetical protein
VLNIFLKLILNRFLILKEMNNAENIGNRRGRIYW